MVRAERESLLESLKRSDQQKDEFLAVLAHELRNPLAGIRTAVYLLERLDASDERRAHAVTVIARQSEHLVRLIDDLLDITRISRGKIQLRHSLIDLGRLTAQVAEDQQMRFENGGVTLDVSIPPQPVTVMGDDVRTVKSSAICWSTRPSSRREVVGQTFWSRSAAAGTPSFAWSTTAWA